MQTNRMQALADLAGKSPLEITNALKDFELYDAKSSQKIIDEVYEEFKTKQNVVDNVLKPVMLNIIDGALAMTSAGKKARKKGLTASRILMECENFTYDDDQDIKHDKFAFYQNEQQAVQDGHQQFINATPDRQKYDRNKLADQTKMDAYKKSKVKMGKKLIDDEYTGEKNSIHVRQSNPDKRRKYNVISYQAETDHIVPLERVFNKYQGNYGLSTSDLRELANADSNLAVTGRKINNPKRADSNSEFIRKQEENGKQVDEKTKQIMIEKEKSANKQMDSSANKMIMNNITGKGSKEQQKVILTTAGSAAIDPAKDMAIGNAILFVLKPLYYELKDAIKNGFNIGVDFVESLKIRFTRVKNYVVDNFLKQITSNLWDFIKNFISIFLESLINLFVGIFKKALKLIKECFKLFVESTKVLFGKNSKNMTPAQKGDAIVKIVGSSVIAIAGLALESFIDNYVPEPFSNVISIILTGVSSVLFMYLVDRADIFGVKVEQRRDRILEIFNERIADIEETKNSYNVVAIETLREQRNQFAQIESEIQRGLDSDNIDTINAGLYKIADFFKVDLPYKNTDEFVKYFDSSDVIEI